MSTLQHCPCGCHTLVRGNLCVNWYHEHLHQQGETWKPYKASLPRSVPAPRLTPPMAAANTDQVKSYPSLTVADLQEIDPKHRP
jgi:hypothetical protein